MWGLVYGCLLTVFACVWTAVHPNVPQHDGDIWSFSSHVGLMMASLVSPEWILGTAWRQFMLSRRVSKKYKMVEGWTLTHSYFVVMDGFFDPSKGKVVVPEKLQKYPGIIEKTGNTRKAAITRKGNSRQKQRRCDFQMSRRPPITMVYHSIRRTMGNPLEQIATRDDDARVCSIKCLCLCAVVE
ncbi:uncharacterized protein EI90DRAFT_3171096 [Cantharellus anzutake]|uniref:uncharacterized protein n=1 Tax=Cantharellus anzutake TaxID=1750568 RepID=UPI0019039C40|nr:uncharacterized protein EI90DRAFT_3171096 [Cantharellus anzutake]KAF8316735.1 hypothetical protein EI90DRAFT_3171096 [Cantharellus anzutake]